MDRGAYNACCACTTQAAAILIIGTGSSGIKRQEPEAAVGLPVMAR